jgi:hypothetical protein
MKHLILILLPLIASSQSTDSQVVDLIVIPRVEMIKKKIPRVTIHNQTRRMKFQYRLTTTIDIEGRKSLHGKIEVMQWVLTYNKRVKAYALHAERITRFGLIEDAVQLPTIHCENTNLDVRFVGSCAMVAVNRRTIAVKGSQEVQKLAKWLPYMQAGVTWLRKNPLRLEAKAAHIGDRE